MFRSFIVLTLAVFLTATTFLPVYADETGEASSQEGNGFSVTFKDAEDDSVIANFPAAEGDTYGTGIDEDVSISVRDTYYDRKSGIDYDLDTDKSDPASLNGTISNENPNPVFYYRKHEDTAEVTLSAVTSDGTVLKTKTFEFRFGQSREVDPAEELGETLTDEDGKVYHAPYQKVTIGYTRETSLDPRVVYTADGEEETTVADTHEVTVNFVLAGSKDDDRSAILTSCHIYVGDQTVNFYAPARLSLEKYEDGKSTTQYFTISKEKAAWIRIKPTDTTKTYNVEYKEADSLEWHIVQYNSETNKVIGIEKVTVPSGGKAEYKIPDTLTIDGSTYTVNSVFRGQTLTRSYEEGSAESCVYYDPEGYTGGVKTKTVSISFQAVNSTAESRSIVPDGIESSFTVSSDKPLEFTLPETLTADGKEYTRIENQTSTLKLSYFSPRTVYMVYYKEKGDTSFYTITTERTEEVTVPGETTYNIIPGITRTVITNTSNGASNTVSVTDRSGASVVQADSASGVQNTGNYIAGNNTAGNNTNGSAKGNSGVASDGSSSEDTQAGFGNSADEGQDPQASGTENAPDEQNLIDGVQSDEIQTPQGNIKLESRTGTGRKAPVIAGTLAAAAAAIVVLYFILARRRKAK